MCSSQPLLGVLGTAEWAEMLLPSALLLLLLLLLLVVAAAAAVRVLDLAALPKRVGPVGSVAAAPPSTRSLPPALCSKGRPTMSRLTDTTRCVCVC